MLRTLSIKNIALISSSEIEFSGGLNILTGETGAGKSIIIDSLNFVLGARADKSLVRHGQNEAIVEAEFSDINTSVMKMLDEYVIDYSEGMIITRRMTSDGRNVCRINGVKLPVGVLRDIAGAVVDIYGQHENSVLLNVDSHIGIIDMFGGVKLSKVQEKYTSAYREYKKVCSAIKKYSTIMDAEIRLEILQKQLREIEDFGVVIGEESQLIKLCDSYEHIDEIKKSTQNAYSALVDMEGNANDLVSNSVRQLRMIEDYDSELSNYIDRLESVMIEISDVASSVVSIGERLDVDEYEAGRNIERLSALHELEGKYGDTEKDILDYLDKISIEVDVIGNRGYELDKLSSDKIKYYELLNKYGTELTTIRTKTAKKFSGLVVTELRELGMPNTTFSVEITTLEGEDSIMKGATASGLDSIEFMISPNAGEPLKPLGSVISGGEMSRFMLAIKKISAEIDGVNVMVFDEIDTGISGKIAQVVAAKLFDISVSRQVLAVTHLPQLASMADNHYLIEKTTDNVTTSTNIRLLDFDQSVEELAVMIDGVGASDSAVVHATGLKTNAKEYKSR